MSTWLRGKVRFTCLLVILLALSGCDESSPDEATDTGVVDTGAEDTSVEDTADVSEDGFDAFADDDEDGLINALEDRNGNGIYEPELGETNPNNIDSDNDGIEDGVEDSDQNGFRDTGETDPANPDTDGDGLLDGAEDTNLNGTLDEGETDPINADTDADGIPDGVEVESELGLDPTNPDTDDDGLPDGLEDFNHDGVYDPLKAETDPTNPDTDGDRITDGCEDRNANGFLDEGETDPRSLDSDGDNINDGSECNNPPEGSCPNFDNIGHCVTDPTNPDTDGDGLTDFLELTSNYGGGIGSDPRKADTDGDGVPDGLEDFNQNGTYDPALGELNPIDPQTDGSTPDAERPQAQACLNKDVPAVLSSEIGRFQLAYDDALNAFEQTYTTAPGSLIASWTLDHSQLPLSAFIISKRPGADVTNAREQEEYDQAETFSEIPGLFPRGFTTWDGFPARTTTYRIRPDAGDTVSIRNSLVRQLTGASTVDGLPSSGGTSSNGYQLTLTTVYRSSDQVVLIGALIPLASDDTVEDAHEVASINLTNATGLAKLTDRLALTESGDTRKACNIFRITQLPIVDFLFIIDDTGSMGQEQDELNQATDDIFTAIQSSLISARWTIASTEIGQPAGGGDGTLSHCGLLQSPKGPGGTIWAPFTSQYKTAFQCRVKDPFGADSCSSSFVGGSEYGLVCAKWAIDYFQGRRGELRAEDLQRPRSELIVIIITDEDEDLMGANSSTFDPADSDEFLDMFGVASWEDLGTADERAATMGQSFIDYFKTLASSPPYGQATPFLIYRKNAESDRRVYYDFIDEDPETFPAGASMDINEINQIPEFVQKIIRTANGLASTFEPANVPITVGMRVVVQRAFTTESFELFHSLEQGWSYDPVAGSMVFFGEDRPRLLDSFAISYAYWEPIPEE